MVCILRRVGSDNYLEVTRGPFGSATLNRMSDGVLGEDASCGRRTESEMDLVS
jgi:hypothetical protein